MIYTKLVSLADTVQKQWVLHVRERYLFLVWIIYYITLLFQTDHNQIEYRGKAFPFLLLAIVHALLFLFVSHVLVPKLLYRKKKFIFAIVLGFLLFCFGAFEESYLEKWILPYRYDDNFDVFAIWGFMGEISVPLLIFTLTRIIFDTFQSQQRVAEVNKQQLTTELKFLRSQIQPHILFNSLNSLYDFTVQKSDKAPELVLELSRVLRYVLYEGDREYIALEKELRFVREYIALHNVQLENRGEAVFHLDVGEAEEGLAIAPFLLVPFIENSFKHSLKTKEEGIDIDIQLQVSGMQLQLNVRNDYSTINSSRLDLVESGIGLENVKKRLQLLYPNKHLLSITDKEEVYRVALTLQLHR